MRFHLAQVNIARMRGDLKSAAMAGIARRIDRMNALADQSKGFVWRLPGPSATPESLRAFAEYFVPFEPERLFYNLSVWESVEDLRAYVFQSMHAEMLRQKDRWMEGLDRPHLALWWIPAGCLPTIADSADRLRLLQANGPGPHAFTFGKFFPPPADRVRRR
jgi:hypothetical protein